MPSPARFTLTNRRGQRLVSLINYPSATEPVAHTLVLCHGYGGDKDGRYLREIAATLTAAGGATVRFDFANGAGESDGTLRDASVAGYADDLDDVLDFVSRQPRLTGGPISIGGHSYAGMVVLVVAARCPDLATVFFLAAVFNRTREFAMEDIVAQITAPIVIVGAGADREVASDQADALARVAGARIVTRHTIASADHNFTIPGTAAQLATFVRDVLLAPQGSSLPAR